MLAACNRWRSAPQLLDDQDSQFARPRADSTNAHRQTRAKRIPRSADFAIRESGSKVPRSGSVASRGSGRAARVARSHHHRPAGDVQDGGDNPCGVDAAANVLATRHPIATDTAGSDTQRMTNPRCGAFLISEGGFSPLVAADVTSSHDFDLVRGYLSASSRPNCGFPRRGAHNGSTRSSGTEMGDGIVKRRASCSIAASCSPTRRYVSAKFVGCRRSHGSGHQFSPRVDRQCAGAGPERAERLVDGPPRATRGEWQPLEQSHVSISESHHTLATLSFATQAPLRAAWPRT